jgi:cupin fold WbuC family metalloprotein
VRLCTHRSADDSLHEMLIVHARGTYVPPHKHPAKSESFHVIEGHVDVVIFGEDGSVAEVMNMGEFTSGKPFYYRMADALYHTLVIRSATLVFHEITNGPFRRSDTIFAPWAPDETDLTAVATFLATLEERILATKRSS